MVLFRRNWGDQGEPPWGVDGSDRVVSSWDDLLSLDLTRDLLSNITCFRSWGRDGSTVIVEYGSIGVRSWYGEWQRIGELFDYGKVVSLNDSELEVEAVLGHLPVIGYWGKGNNSRVEKPEWVEERDKVTGILYRRRTVDGVLSVQRFVDENVGWERIK